MSTLSANAHTDIVKHSYTMFNAPWRNECQYHALLPPMRSATPDVASTTRYSEPEPLVKFSSASSCCFNS